MEERKKTQSLLMCPHLGILEDPDTSHAFPSSGNYCFYAKSPTVPNFEQQETMCLTAAYTSCPVYQAAKKPSFPDKLRNKNWLSAQPKRSNRIYVYIGVVVLLVLLAGWFASQMFTFPMSAIPSSPTGNQGQTQAVIIKVTTTARDMATDTAQPTEAFTPTALVTPTITAEASVTLTNTPNLHALEIPFKIGGRQFLIHRVIEGEGVDYLIKTYKTTKEVIEAANYSPPIPVWADSLIVLHPGMTEIDPNEPSFQPYEVTDQAITFEELAKKLKVDLVALKYYNACADNCTLVSGNWILIARQK